MADLSPSRGWSNEGISEPARSSMGRIRRQNLFVTQSRGRPPPYFMVPSKAATQSTLRLTAKWRAVGPSVLVRALTPSPASNNIETIPLSPRLRAWIGVQPPVPSMFVVDAGSSRAGAKHPALRIILGLCREVTPRKTSALRRSARASWQILLLVVLAACPRATCTHFKKVQFETSVSCVA